MTLWGEFKGNLTQDQCPKEPPSLHFSGAVNPFPFRADVAGCYHPHTGLLLQGWDDVIRD